jgi:hypothetical protein
MTTIPRVVSVSLTALVLASGCASTDYIYEPAEQANATLGGRTAAHYEIPAEAPAGDVRVTSFGITEVAPAGGGPRMHVLHARMVVANNSDAAPWSVDTREQFAWIPGEGKSRPAFVNSDDHGAPVLMVAQSQQRMIDLYYPLPVNVKSEDKLAGFDLLWQVTTGRRVVAERTPFERLQIEPVYATGYDYSFALGWGPYWWYDPFWPHATFVHPGVVVRRPVTFGHPQVIYHGGRVYGARPTGRYR